VALWQLAEIYSSDVRVRGVSSSIFSTLDVTNEDCHHPDEDYHRIDEDCHQTQGRCHRGETESLCINGFVNIFCLYAPRPQVSEVLRGSKAALQVTAAQATS